MEWPKVKGKEGEAGREEIKKELQTFPGKAVESDDLQRRADARRVLTGEVPASICINDPEVGVTARSAAVATERTEDVATAFPPRNSPMNQKKAPPEPGSAEITEYVDK